MSILKFVTAARFLRRKFVTAAGFRRRKFATAAGFTENITKYNEHAIKRKHRIGEGSPKLSILDYTTFNPSPIHTFSIGYVGTNHLPKTIYTDLHLKFVTAAASSLCSRAY